MLFGLNKTVRRRNSHIFTGTNYNFGTKITNYSFYIFAKRFRKERSSTNHRTVGFTDNFCNKFSANQVLDFYMKQFRVCFFESLIDSQMSVKNLFYRFPKWKKNSFLFNQCSLFSLKNKLVNENNLNSS